MFEVIRQPLANEDLEEIWLYTYDKWGIKQAESYTKALFQAMNRLIEFPKIGRPIDHDKSNYRLYHFRHHYIVYQETAEAIKIIRVLGEQMDVKRHV